MSAPAPTLPVKSADRALSLLGFIASRGSVSFTDILNDFGMPRSSAHGLLQTMLSAGWIEQNEQGKRYSLGLRAWQVGQLYAGHRDLANVAKPVMDKLAATVGETVQLARLDGIENVYIAISDSPNPMRLVSSVGMRLLAHATGIGKALLSQLEPAEAERRLRSASLPRLTDKTVVDVDRLLELIDFTRVEGYALDDEEYISGCRCVAVPLTREDGTHPTTALSITMPTSRTDAAWPQSILEPLAVAAREIRSIVGVEQLPVTG